VNRLRLSIALCILLLVPHLTLAQDDPLSRIGRLFIEGRTAEARPQILALRDDAIARKDASREASAWLLLGMADVSGGDEVSARANLLQAEAKYTALGDSFGAWFALWMLAEVESWDGGFDAAIAVHERAQELLTRAADPSAPFTLDTLKILGPVFGMPAEALGPAAQYPQMLKPFMLQFAGAVASDAHGHLLIDAGRDLGKAEELLNKAAATSKLFGGFLDGEISVHLGELRQLQWRFEEARELYIKGMDSAKRTQRMVRGGPLLEVGVLNRLAELESLSGRVDEALRWNDQALSLVRAAGDRKRETDAIETRGELLKRAGRDEEALALYEQAMNLARGTNDLRRQASIHANIGTLHMFKGRYGGAVEHLEKAIAIYQSRGETLLESTTWMILAEVHNLLGVTDRNAIDNALALAKKSRYKLAGAMASVIASFDSVTRGKGKQEDVEAMLKAWRDLPETKTLMFGDGMHDVLVATLHSGLGKGSGELPGSQTNLPPFARWLPLMLKGKAQLEQGRYAAARGSFTEALALDPGNDLRAGLFALIGTTYWKEGKRDETIKLFQDAAKTLEASAFDVKVEELLASYLGTNRRVYFEVLVDMLAKDGRTDEAFAQAERARARAFLQLVGNHRFNAGQGADPRLAREAETLRTHMIEREQAIQNAEAPEASRIREDLLRERERYRTLLTRVKASNPEYASLTIVEPSEIAAIRDEIQPDVTVVSYFVAPHGVHVWVIDRVRTHHALLPLDRAGLQRIVCWASQIGPREDMRGARLPGACAETATAAEAYDKLIAPIRNTIGTRKVVLIPHGPLHYVPFAALHERESGKDLIDQFILTYAPSASTLRFLRAKESPVDGTALILGNPASPLPALRSLPGAEREATAIARMLGATARIGTDARESLLYNLAGKTDLVHLAAHGLYDGGNPLFSRIALAPGEAHDGSLTVDEILSSVDLAGVNLVILSACRTAAGARSGGDEVVGLTRALLYAGTPGVLSTLWNIDDTASAGLMEELYRGLTQGKSAAEALRDAQLTVRETHPHPRYWAAFTLHGDPQGRWKSH
jgi:CHAT domain-containing protein/Tfp pilus assembly protein PilF